MERAIFNSTVEKAASISSSASRLLRCLPSSRSEIDSVVLSFVHGKEPPALMKLSPNLVEGSSTSKLHRTHLVTHGFVRNCEPSKEVTNPAPI